LKWLNAAQSGLMQLKAAQTNLEVTGMGSNGLKLAQSSLKQLEAAQSV